MMETPPPAKRIKSTSFTPSSQSLDTAEKVWMDVVNVPFPWEEAVPPNIREWIETFAKAYNTAPEYVFMGTLATCAALMGPSTCVQVRETYHEPTNIYAICVGLPGSGKSQAFRMSTGDPLKKLPQQLSTMLVDDYTKKGLFRHLQCHKGRALLAHEEMGAFFDLVQKRQLEGCAERQLYCRLYDGGQWTTSTGIQLSYSDLWTTVLITHIYTFFQLLLLNRVKIIIVIHVGLRKEGGRQEVDRNCVCISGFVQPQPFFTRIYPQLTESDDGFVDRLLVCIPKTRVLREEVRQEINVTL